MQDIWSSASGDPKFLNHKPALDSVRSRQQTEEALRRSEEPWRLIYESEPECVKVVSADGRLLDMNPAGLVMIEVESLDQARCQPLLSFVAPEHRDDFSALHQRVIGGESGQLIFEIIGLKGTRRWLETHAVPFRAVDGSVCHLGITRDISERKRAEEALLESERRFRELYESSRDAIFVEDTEGNVLDVNPAACRLHGLTREQLLGCNVRDLVPESQRAELERDFLKLLSGELTQAEGVSLQANGTRVPVELTVSRMNYCGQPALLLHVRDIQKRKQVAAALRESEERLRLTLDNAQHGLWDWDLTTGRTHLDDLWYAIHGYAKDELPPNYELWEQSIHPEDKPHVMEVLTRHLKTGDTLYDVDYRARTKSGEWIWVNTRGRVYQRDADGKPQRMLGTIHDITARKQASEELQASHQRLATLSRQLIAAQESERRRLSRELHDEIGQSLTGIKMNLKALLQPDAARRLATLVPDTLAVVDQTLQQVRNLALDLRPSQLDDIGLVAALRWCLDRQAQRAGFAAQFLADPPDCVASPEIAIACFRVAQESLTNIARHANAQHVRVELRQVDASLELIVRDDGGGFDVSAARERATRGASLGLLGMLERVELVSGQLEIQSNSSGTIVHVRFPLRIEEGQ